MRAQFGVTPWVSTKTLKKSPSGKASAKPRKKRRSTANVRQGALSTFARDRRRDDVSQGAAAAMPSAGSTIFLTVDEVAALLRVNRKTVYEAIAARELPGARKLRGVVRVHRETLVRWFLDGGLRRKSR